MGVERERAAWVALALVPGIGPARLATLMEHCETATGALSAPFAFLGTLPGLSRAAATALQATSVEEGERVIAEVEGMGARILIPSDPEFPQSLRDIPDTPPLLFALGDLALLGLPTVAVVGSRDHSGYGEWVAEEVARVAAGAGIVVASGMARGLDAVAHAAALDAGGTSIGVLGNGLGVIYPAANRRLYERMAEAGLLLTEFPPGERPMAHSFPRRNRLISGLARVTVVIEAAEGSGTLITVGTALAQGRDVMAVPGPITSPTSVGTNRLIRDGAEPLLVGGDLLGHFPEAVRGADPPPPREVAAREEGPGVARPRRRGGEVVVEPPGCPLPIPPDLPEAEQRLALALREGPRDFDGLIRVAGLPASVALAALSGLELRGLIVQEPGVVRWGIEGRGTYAKLK